MAPFFPTKEEEHKISQRPVLHVATPERTPEVTPAEANDPGFDWKQWDGPGWHNQPWPQSDIKRGRDIKAASSQLPTPMDLPSPISEDLLHQPACQKCGLTTKQHEMIRAYICGHLCRDIPNEKICPDINAFDLGIKDWLVPNHGTSRLTRRRSSLSKSPMVARDESTYEDVDQEKKSTDAAHPPAETHRGEIKESPANMKPFQHNHTESVEKPAYHVCCNASGDADWRKHCRVEKAMKQILFGDAKVSAPTVLEHTQRLGTSERNLAHHEEGASITQDPINDFKNDELCSAMVAAKIAAKKHAKVNAEQCAVAKEEATKRDELKSAEAESAEHLLDCAICSDGEDEA